MPDPTDVFVDHRELLFSIVYGLLGSVADTEDVLQETWLAWASRPADTPVEYPKAYLVRAAVNQALARQATIRRRRETYVGPWLPEPLISTDAADAAVLRTESLSLALLVVLETLSPAERAVFVLHEVFGYPQATIAEMLDRSPAAVRQLAHRAREHVRTRRPRYPADQSVREAVTERFVAALRSGDLTAFLELLAPDVTLWTDGGGKARAVPRPVTGRDAVARVLATIGTRYPDRFGVEYRLVNGDLSLLLRADGAPFGVMVLDLTDDGSIPGVYTITNPDKLTGVRS
ncbi:RNA polymerase sigma factor SigJ [Cryptosporangium aurantiacum]|uniref:RNA polymerase sigma-70 factor, ECF subfamily n=1 Tax=Cryptosporangium aurantiacum TaxID=134849 RepID=A0A1M7QFJ1_9ACTN|nr:RNA polymerase sigma factor SigJ [Cryptosporangium aurantiacum]SHN29695.1 RNA polymerase sigma-70 factor, ECF subfamily [Cryptosporangium aurantiacum]